jgi:hypothetical protein
MLLLCKQKAGETTKTVDGTLLVQTVQENFKGYTKREILQSKVARRAHAMIGSPSEKDYMGMVSSNIIKNFPITVSNVANVQNIFGTDLGCIQGKTVQRTPVPVVVDYVAVPRLLVEANLIVLLASDMLFVDGTAFLLRVSRRIKFVTAEHVLI